MKTIEEKAKAYDESIARAKAMIKVSENESEAKNYVWTIFPELAESEDEKIRKAIINMVETEFGDRFPFNGFTREQMIAWLEKQGEHYNFLSKIKIGDKVTRNEDGVLVNLSQLKRIAKPAEEYNITGIGSKNAQGKLGEMIKNLKPVNEVLEHDSAWSEKYIADVFEKVGLAKIVREQSNDNLTNALQDALIELGKFMPQQTSAWSEEDEKQARQIERIVHDDGCTQKLQKQIADWFKSLKDRVQSQPKQEWSAEDKVILDEIIDFFENGTVKLQHDLSLYASWLKSLKQRYTWKPSDKQINAFEQVYDWYNNNFAASETLTSLYQDLKKLKGE